MITVYLYLNAVLYFVFSIWCLFKFQGTANYLGYSFQNNSGRVEYLTIYTGLQMGFAAFLGLCAWHADLRLAGLIFCVALYTGIVITRISSALYFGNLTNATYYVGALEVGLCLWGIALLVTALK